jgi:hypothetical protein
MSKTSFMKYFIIYAHPEPMSLSGHLKDRAVAALEAAGHEVIVSDLYAMEWKAVYDAKDFPERKEGEPLNYDKASGEAFKTGTQAADIAEEQRKLLWADVVILQFHCGGMPCRPSLKVGSIASMPMASLMVSEYTAAGDGATDLGRALSTGDAP